MPEEETTIPTEAVSEIELDNGVTITREEFESYVSIQRVGSFNMMSRDAMECVGFDPRDRDDKHRYSSLLSNYKLLSDGFGIVA